MSHLKVIIAKEMQQIREQKARLEQEKQEAVNSQISSRLDHARVLAILIQRMNNDLLELHFQYQMVEPVEELEA